MMKQMFQILIIALLTVPVRLPAPDSAGSGGDNPAIVSGNAWFPGRERTVTFCIMVSPSFGASEKVIAWNVTQAFSFWKKYLEKKKLEHDLATAVLKLDRCNGAEDLTIFAGTNPPETKNLALQFENPTAFAVRTDKDTGFRSWGRGFIWLANASEVAAFKPRFPEPDYGQGNRWEDVDLRFMLLHEVGHVFGNAHVEGTIMTSQVASALPLEPAAQHSYSFGNALIDWEQQLSRCGEGYDDLYSYRSSLSNPDSVSPTSKAFAKKLLEREPIGQLKMTFRLPGKGSKSKALLKVSDANGGREFEVESSGGGFESPSRNAPWVFKSVFGFDGVKNFGARHQSIVQFWKIALKEGEFPLTSAYNMDLKDRMPSSYRATRGIGPLVDGQAPFILSAVIDGGQVRVNDFTIGESSSECVPSDK